MNAKLMIKNLFFSLSLLAILLSACATPPATSAPIAVAPVAKEKESRQQAISARRCTTCLPNPASAGSKRPDRTSCAYKVNLSDSPIAHRTG